MDEINTLAQLAMQYTNEFYNTKIQSFSQEMEESLQNVCTLVGQHRDDLNNNEVMARVTKIATLHNILTYHFEKREVCAVELYRLWREFGLSIEDNAFQGVCDYFILLLTKVGCKRRGQRTITEGLVAIREICHRENIMINETNLDQIRQAVIENV